MYGAQWAKKKKKRACTRTKGIVLHSGLKLFANLIITHIFWDGGKPGETRPLNDF